MLIFRPLKRVIQLVPFSPVSSRSRLAEPPPPGNTPSDDPFPQTRRSIGSLFTTQTAGGQILLLGLLWATFWGGMAVGQAAGWGVGLRIWPNGEDYNWVYMLEHFPGMELPKVFWQIDHRNPLAAWWYLAAKPIIATSPSGWFLLRRIVDLVLAVTVLMLLRRFDRNASSFPLFCAVGVLFTSYTHYPWAAMNIWTMSVAMIAGMWSLYAYSRHVEEGGGRWFGLSLVLYLVAAGTYTLQASVLLAVPLLGWFGRGAKASRGSRFLQTAGEASLFAAVFGLFYVIWVTATPSGAFSHETLALSRVGEQFVRSLAFHVFPPHGYGLVRTQFSVAEATRILLAVGLAALAVLILIARSPARGLGLPSGRALGGAAYLAASLSCGSILLESTSDTFVPGTRSVMSAQAVLPIVYAAGLFAAVKLLAAISSPLARTLQVGAAAALIAFCALMTVTMNHLNARTTRTQVDFVRTVNEVIGPLSQPTHLVVFPEDGDAINPVFESPLVNARHRGPNRLMIQSVMVGPRLTEADAEVQLSLPGRVLFGRYGVKFTRWFTTPAAWVPYDQVVFARWVGKRLEFLNDLPPSYLERFRVGVDQGVTLEDLRVRVPLGYHRLVVGPVVAHWEGGFSALEFVPTGERWRWCDRDGVLRLENPTGSPIRYRFSTELRPAPESSGERELTISGPGFVETVRLDGEGVKKFNREFVIPPGKYEIRFRHAGEVQEHPARTLAFALYNFQLGIPR